MDIPILPLAVTMMAGPQEMSAIVLVTHPTPVRVSVAFLIGATGAMLLGTTLAYLFASALGGLGQGSDNGSGGKVIQFVLVALLVGLAIRTYLHRETIEPPKWMGSLFEATPRKTLMMGFVLILVMPTDVATMLTVGVHLKQNHHSLIDAAPFWGLTLLIAALPILSYVVFQKRAKVAMPKARDWMTKNSWLVNIFVLGLFVFLILS